VSRALKISVGALVLALTGCAAVGGGIRGGLDAACPTCVWNDFVRANQGKTEFARDSYECKRQNTYTSLSATPSLPGYGQTVQSSQNVDYTMAVQCLSARGWRAR